jgi:beta-1,4-mannosyl-glycoprotein beta-1,4-N-acetylglucosaminyltransferase
VTTWDCFLFNQELDLLDFRLDLLQPVVDRVMIVEAPVTFRRARKPLHFAEHADRFERHRDRIVHVVANELDVPMSSPWDRERAQHAAIKSALEREGVASDDMVIVGDVDEIPAPEVLADLARSGVSAPSRLVLRHAVYFANWELPSTWTDGPMVAMGSQLGHHSLGLLLGDPTAAWGETNEPMIEGCGWHLSYLGGVRSVALKHEQLSDTSFDLWQDKDAAHLDRCLRLGVHFSGRSVLSRLPAEVLDPLQQRLLTTHPQMFDFSTAPRHVADQYRAYTRIRRRLPSGMVRAADRLYLRSRPVMGPSLVSVEKMRDRLTGRTTSPQPGVGL